jgi:hypothetical protein
MSYQDANRYEVILAGKYCLGDLIESISLDDSLSEIAYRANIRLVNTPDLPELLPGQAVEINGTPFGGTRLQPLLSNGVIWEVEAEKKGQPHITLTIYDKMVYLAKSEDEYLFPDGQTATQRLKKYTADWQIPAGELAETGVPLARAVFRAQPIYAMLKADLNETVSKGGDMFRPRMGAGGLDLIKLGGNQTVWVLEADQNLESTVENSTLEGAVTQVKVLGPDSNGGSLAPVLGIVKGETDKYGTIQKILSDSKVRTGNQAESAGKKLLSGARKSITVNCLDINTIRAGDKVKLNSAGFLVASVRHELGNPGHMTLTLAAEEQVRREYYGQ